MIPLSLYIHIPWCIRKCPYCDFNSHKSPGILPEESYINALIADLKVDLTRFSSRALYSIFIGGGTPSLLSAMAYDSLFHQIQQLIPFSENIEITMEANPGTFEYQKFRDYRLSGINRLSIGIQSFNPAHLKALGRIHDDNQAHLAIDAAAKAGFENINLDIMYGLPHQTTEQGLEDLQKAIAHQTTHLSWYQLTIEPNTVFYKKTPVLPAEEITGELEEEGLALIERNGFQRYEISAFCKPGKPAQHNMNYWLFGDYLGIGAGAHGKLTTVTEDGSQVFRTRKLRQPIDYLNPDKPFLAAIESIRQENLVFEFMLNTSRLQQPIAKSLFPERTGLAFDKLAVKLDEAQKKGLIDITDTHWQVTASGRRYTNDLQELFLP